MTQCNLLILFFIIISSVTNQKVANAFEYSTEDMKEEFLSPFQPGTGRNIIGYGTLLAVSLKLFAEDEVIMPFQKSITKENKLGELNEAVDYLGRWVPNLLYLGGMSLKYYLSPDDNKDKASLEKGFAMFRATVYACTITVFLKNTVRQRRPGASDNRLSFPSGHATTAFAFASVVSSFHEWYYAVPAYGIATMVAYQRLANNNHYLHDIIAGAAIGAAYGVAVSNVVKNKHSFMNNVMILPTSSNGLMVNYSYQF